jgi:ribosomal protein L21E
MTKTKATAKTQGAKAERSKGKKAETQELVKYEGKQKFVISKDFARFKKGDEVVVVFERALKWRSKGII